MTATFAERAESVFAGFTDEERDGLSGLEVLDASLPHPFYENRWLLADLSEDAAAGRVIRVYQGSFRQVAESDDAFDSQAALEESIAHQATRHHEDRACAKAYASEDSMFAAHAGFRDGEALLPGWYRQGSWIQAYAWAVDNDVFIELALRKAVWESLRGTSLTLTLPDADLELDVPDDASIEETWQIEGGGLFEEDPGIDIEALEDDDEVTGRFGDLHIVLVITDA